jgi:hypothetical protein
VSEVLKELKCIDDTLKKMMHHSVQEGEIEVGVDRELNTGPQLGV